MPPCYALHVNRAEERRGGVDGILIPVEALFLVFPIQVACRCRIMGKVDSAFSPPDCRMKILGGERCTPSQVGLLDSAAPRPNLHRAAAADFLSCGWATVLDPGYRSWWCFVLWCAIRPAVRFGWFESCVLLFRREDWI